MAIDARILGHVPSDSGPWMTQRGEDDTPHVLPGYGPDHKLSMRCWCHPYVEDERYPETGVVVHNVPH